MDKPKVFWLRGVTNDHQQELHVYCEKDDEPELAGIILNLATHMVVEVSLVGDDSILTNEDGSINEDCIANSVGDVIDIFSWMIL